ncbi:hypothetical protein GIB67_033589 [Kingdonia uniflora]|uniref:Gluconokinase n=1 Tax=Kingdonia uniflora TaxID=39325 RepID=A0A7J7LAC3_9MAGN|nr:hypothetical protein GIB67_033589 [Kingdonia uniflora]
MGSSDDPNNKPIKGSSAPAVVLMGVSGSGKSTIGNMLATIIDCNFLDADDFHPQANKEKMSKGIPLSEEDRIPWLETLRDTLKEHLRSGETVVLGCSALQKSYREILRMADRNYKPGSYGGKVRFVCLEAPMEVILARLEKRATEGNHFMPPTLLKSQLELLQIDYAEEVIMVDATLSPQIIVNNIRAQIN